MLVLPRRNALNIAFMTDQHGCKHSRGTLVYADTIAKLITGRGKGSPDQISRLKPAVETYLTERGILQGLEPGNNGVICIHISRGQQLKPYNKVWY